jgi:hypothetical protein
LITILLRHLTFARVVSMVAVFVALGAGAYAAGKDSVKSKQIKDGAVATVDLGDGAVTGQKIADGSITGPDVGNDKLSGADVNESTLQIPDVASSNAVGGLQVKKINFQSGIANGVVRSIVAFPNIFRIDAQCANNGDELDIAAFTAFDNSTIGLSTVRAAGANDTDMTNDIASSGDLDFDSNEAFPVDNNLVGQDQATIFFEAPNGFVVKIEMLVFHSASKCVVVGTAVGG